jgi:hypothetical protein
LWIVEFVVDIYDSDDDDHDNCDDNNNLDENRVNHNDNYYDDDDDDDDFCCISCICFISPHHTITGWSYPSDIWSAGCIIAEIYSGDLLFKTVRSIDMNYDHVIDNHIDHDHDNDHDEKIKCI